MWLRCTPLWLAAMALIGCGALSGCGMAGAQPTIYRDDGYGAIERDESVIERERVMALGAEADACNGACNAVTAICAASERICAVAQDLQEASAFTRCSRARESCAEAREHVARTCTCPAEGAGAGGPLAEARGASFE